MALFKDATEILDNGNNKQVKKIEDSNGVMIWGSQTDFPYRRLEYIESTDNSAKGKYVIQLDFGFSFSNLNHLDIDYQLTNATFNQSTGQYYGGMLSTSNLDTRIVYTANNNSKLRCYWNGTGTQADITSYAWDTNRHMVGIHKPGTLTNARVYVDGTNRGNIGPVSPTAGTYLSLFGQKYDGSEYSILAKLYECSIYTESDSVKTYSHRLIPCQRKSDGAIGVYDTVGQVFYGNNGSGTFTAGPIVNEYWDGTL